MDTMTTIEAPNTTKAHKDGPAWTVVAVFATYPEADARRKQVATTSFAAKVERQQRGYVVKTRAK